VSGSHRSLANAGTMNWDTLGQIDVVVAGGTSSDLASALANRPHDRPVAIIFAPGPPLAGQDRSASAVPGDIVSQCGGNYNPANYLDPSIAAVQGGTSVYFPGNRNVDAGVTPVAVAIQGSIEKDAANILHGKCQRSANCTTVANDQGLALTSDELFGALRKSSSFRTDINAMLERMIGCLRDEILASGGSLATPYAKIAGADANPCYGSGVDPRGYYPNYKEMFFVAAPGSVTVTVDGALQPSCAGSLILAGQRDTATSRCPAATPTNVQNRRPGAEQLDACNYLEAPNLASFTSSGTTFAGPSLIARVTANHPAYQDIVRCIPSTASFVAAPSALPLGDELSRYDPATRTLTLGRQNIESDEGYAANALFGCAWTPETRAVGSGFRSYFKFNILDSGDGFTFAAIDGDRNSAGVCGAAEQHLGYSGNNTFTSIIANPKLGLEFDTRRNFQSNPPFLPNGFNPARTTSTSPLALRTLANGRADPNYTGGHIGLVYWGGESPIGTGATCGTASPPCLSPSFCDTDNICKLNPEEDDNVHGQLPTNPATRPPPRNEPAPAGPPSPPPYPPYAVDKLDPSLSSVPTNRDIHVRIEVGRTYAGRDDNSRLVKVVAATNLATLSGLQAIDSVTLQTGDTVMVVAQTDAKTNGIYVAAAGPWSRAENADESADLPPGTSWFVKEGLAYRGSLWRLLNTEAPVVNNSDISISIFREPVAAVATTNLALGGLQTVDGVVLTAGSRVLLTGQTDTKENGVYVASAGAWTRATLENTPAGMRDGATWFSTNGAGSYWRLNGDATPGTSNIAISAISFPSNNTYSATVTTQVWKQADSPTVANQIARMSVTTRSMNQLDPVIKHAQCILPGNTCPASNPDGQSCGGVEADGFRYCYTGQKPNLYDRKQIFDIRTTTSCGSNVNCSGNQFCGIDQVCYQPAFRTARLGFTASQSTSDQEINITDFFTTWLP
jgi:hypothetical protein